MSLSPPPDPAAELPAAGWWATPRTQWQRRGRYLGLLVLPLAWWCLISWATTVRGPYYLGPNQDPEYMYLTNSLLVADGQVPWHVDNPGTPLQALGGLVMRVRHATQAPPPGDPRAASLADDVLRTPEASLLAIHGVALALLAWLWAVVGLAVYRHTGRWGLALAVQAAAGIAPALAAEATRVRPEALQECCGLLLTLVLLPVSAGPRLLRFGWARCVALGVVLALGVALKFTALPLLLLVFLPAQPTRILIAGAAVLAALPLWLWPALPQHEVMEQWLLDLARHSGHYGSGGVGLPALGELAANAAGLVRGAPVFFLALALVLAALGVMLRHRRAFAAEPQARERVYLVVLLFAALLAQVAVVVKHPSDHYLVPALMLLGPLLLALDGAAMGSWLPAAAARTARRLAAVVLLLGLLWTLGATIQEGRAARANAAAVTALHTRVERLEADGPVFRYFRCSSLEYALNFGNDSAGWAYSAVLLRAYPSATSYYRWYPPTFHRFGHPVDMPTLRGLLAQGAPVFLWGSTIMPGDDKDFPFQVSPVDQAASESVYLLRAIPQPMEMEQHPERLAPQPPGSGVDGGSR